MKLRRLDLNDAPRMLEWMHDTDVTQYFRFDGKASTIQTVEKFIKESSLNQAAQHYAVTTDNDKYMGTVSLKNIDLENKHAEYAISLHMDAIGKGYARFATDNILKVAFNELHLNKVYLNVLSINVRANRFYEKYGFVFEGEFKEHMIHNGRFENLRWYRMLASEFKNY